MNPPQPADTQGGSTRRFRRVLVAFDWGSENPTAAEHVVSLAARMRAELFALFVEDIDLLRLSEHATVNAFSVLSATGKQLAADQLRRVLRLRLARNRQAVEDAAIRRQIAYASAVRSGRLLAEVMTAAGSDDLAVIGWSGTGTGPSWMPTSTPPMAVARALAESSVRSVLLLHPLPPSGGPVLVPYDSGDAGKSALAAAAQVAGEFGGVITVAVTAGRSADPATLARDIGDLIGETTVHLRVLSLDRDTLADLCRVAEIERASLVVVDAEMARSQGEAGRRALEGLACSLLLVR